MKRYFRTLSLFGLFLLVLLAIIQFSISAGIRNKSIRTWDNLSLTKNVNADLVFLGSSRATAHFDPVFFDSAYKLKSINIGIDGHSELSMAITRLNIYLLDNKPPRYVILNFDPLVAAGNEKNNNNFIHKNDFARYAFLPDKAEGMIADYFDYNFAERYVPAYALLKYQLLWDCIVTRESKYKRTWYEKHENPQEDYSTITDSIGNLYRMPGNEAAIQKKLSELNELCKQKNIQLICIQTPFFSIIKDEKVLSLPGQICSAAGVRYIDANLSEVKETKTNFYNANHMDVDGVKAMNEYLVRHLDLK